MKPEPGATQTVQVQVTAACIENEFPHWKVWTGADRLLHACIPWDTNLYVMAETPAGLRAEIIGCLRLREIALDQLKKKPVEIPDFKNRPQLPLPVFEMSKNGNGSVHKTEKSTN